MWIIIVVDVLVLDLEKMPYIAFIFVNINLDIDKTFIS